MTKMVIQIEKAQMQSRKAHIEGDRNQSSRLRLLLLLPGDDVALVAAAAASALEGAGGTARAHVAFVAQLLLALRVPPRQQLQ